MIYDLVLLDCNMDDMDGLQVAEKLRECDRRAVLVFVTVSRDYAVSGYQVEASDYLVKPFSCEDFTRAMDHIRPLLPSYREYITVPAAPRVRMTFSELLELLAPYSQFLMCYPDV